MDKANRVWSLTVVTVGIFFFSSLASAQRDLRNDAALKGAADIVFTNYTVDGGSMA